MSNATLEETSSGFSVAGEISFGTVNRLLSVSLRIFESKPVLEIDLRGVGRADSAGLALLVEWMARAQRRNTDIQFLNMPEQMREIARMTEVDALLPRSD